MMALDRRVLRFLFHRSARLWVAALCLLASLGLESAVADVSVVKDCFRSMCLQISGQITKGDAKTTTAALKRLQDDKHWVPYFFLDSNGGNIAEAIEVGRILRKERITAIVKAKAQCLSACIFALVGAVERFPIGLVGIHRPYPTDMRYRTYEEMQQEFRAIEGMARRYLQDMNVSIALYDAMMRVSTHEIRYLSQEELEQFGLRGTDPVEQELRDNDEARGLGVTKQEFLARKMRVTKMCEPLLSRQNGETAWFECQKREMEGKLN